MHLSLSYCSLPNLLPSPYIVSLCLSTNLKSRSAPSGMSRLPPPFPKVPGPGALPSRPSPSSASSPPLPKYDPSSSSKSESRLPSALRSLPSSPPSADDVPLIAPFSASSLAIPPPPAPPLLVSPPAATPASPETSDSVTPPSAADR